MEVQKCDEETAQQELDRISKEQSVTGIDIDDFLNGGENNDKTGDDAAQSKSELIYTQDLKPILLLISPNI